MIELETPGAKVNGGIIDFYLESWVSARPESERRQYHIFDTMLYPHLRKENGGTARTAGYVKGLDFCEQNFLLFPINEVRDQIGHHWYLVIFCMFPKLLVETDKQRRCVLFFDSAPNDETTLHAYDAIAFLKKYLAGFSGPVQRRVEGFPVLDVVVHRQATNNCAVNTIRNATNFLGGVDNDSVAGLKSYADEASPCMGDSWKVPCDIREIIRQHISGACACMCACAWAWACAWACARACVPVRVHALARVRGRS